MEKERDPEQMERLDSVPRQESEGVVSTTPVVEPWNVHQAGRIGREQLHSINQRHEIFARNLSHSLAAYLRAPVECKLVSAEHFTYREFLGGIPALSYLASFDVAPAGVLALLQMELPIAFSIIDLLLGGEGQGASPAREVTEIEAQILESIVRIIGRELQNIWQTVGLQFTFGRRLPMSDAPRLMPVDEKNLCLSFELKIGEISGTLKLVVPAVASNALLRKIATDYGFARPKTGAETPARIQRKLQTCPFSVELCVPQLQIPARALVGLEPGMLLRFTRNISSPATLLVGDVRLCSAVPVRVNTKRAAQVLELETSTSRKGEI